MAELPVRLLRDYNYPHGLTLGDLRALVVECDRRRLADSSRVEVDDHARWVEGVDADGNPSPKYPKGDGGHYVTQVTVEGQIDPSRGWS